MKTKKRMDNPDDTLVKRQSAYAGDVIHKYHGFPGEYDGPCVNEFPNSGGGIPRTDSTYYVNLEGRRYVMNVEDESVRVDDDTLFKIDNYRVNIEYGTKLPVINVVRTVVPINRCKTVFHKSPTLTLKPIMVSYPMMDGKQRLSTISSKINSNQILSNVEAMDLVMIPKMFATSQSEILEKVCELLKNLKVEDQFFKMELILEMQCVIHKYAKTLEDIIRLEEVIGLKEVKTARQYQDELLIEKGKEKGKFDLALDLVDSLGIDRVCELTGFSLNELKSGKLGK